LELAKNRAAAIAYHGLSEELWVLCDDMSQLIQQVQLGITA